LIYSWFGLADVEGEDVAAALGVVEVQARLTPRCPVDRDRVVAGLQPFVDARCALVLADEHLVVLAGRGHLAAGVVRQQRDGEDHRADEHRRGEDGGASHGAHLRMIPSP
jgi:hypothetical protein